MAKHANTENGEARFFGWVRERETDPRDIHYHVSPFVLEALPEEESLRPKYTVSPFQQGRQGSCGAQTSSGDILYDELQQAGPDIIPSRAFIYYTTRMLMGTSGEDSGVENRTMLKALNQYGWCDEKTMPYNDADYRTKPSKAAFDEAAKRKIFRYERVAQSKEIIQGCIVQGDPFILGFSVPPSMMSAETTRTGRVAMFKPGERPVGGHDVLCVGYNAYGPIFRNSWGMWGDGGYGELPWGLVLNPNTAGDFWTIRWEEPQPVPVPPQPTPPPIPTPSPFDWAKILEIIKAIIDAIIGGKKSKVEIAVARLRDLGCDAATITGILEYARGMAKRRN